MREHVRPLLRQARGAAAELRAEPEFLLANNFVRHRRRWRLLLRRLVIGIGRILIFVFEAMFDGGRLVRKVGPGMRPLERHEFERNYRDERGGNF